MVGSPMLRVQLRLTLGYLGSIGVSHVPIALAEKLVRWLVIIVQVFIPSLLDHSGIGCPLFSNTRVLIQEIRHLRFHRRLE